MPLTARALWYVAPLASPFPADLRGETLPAPGPGEVLVRCRFSALSRGTERLIACGLVPPSEAARMRAPFQAGDFPFPVKYGYCAVGEVIEGPAELKGRMVFCLHPHQEAFVVPSAMVQPLPPQVPAARGVLAANMETALNALWDSGAGPADRIVVVGAGLVGLLVGFLAAGLPGAEVTLVDVNPARAELARAFGCAFASPDAAPGGADVVFHTSATGAGLASALAAAGQEARVIELSWYGERRIEAPLGGSFHAGRVSLVSSQVGQVAASRRPRWDYGRRLRAALALLADDRLDALITERIAFEDLAAAVPRLLAPDAPGLVTLVHYPA